MYLWRTLTFISLMMIWQITSAEFMCAKDFDGDGKLISRGETALCSETGGGALCPLDAAPCEEKLTCPSGEDRPCFGGNCQVPQTCETVRYGFFRLYRCPDTGSLHGDLTACNGSCIKTAMCEKSEPLCPLAGGGKCLAKSDGSYACSAEPCVDLTATPMETAGIDDRVYLNDGRTDAEGMCLDQVMIYSGRNMECRLAGTSTAFKSCCRGFDEIMTDSTGSISEWTVAASAIKGTFVASKAAFETYKKAADTLSAAEKVDDATSAFKSAFESSFDPASLAISAAVSIAIDYFVNNCNEMDMETGILNASGRCYPIPEDKGGLYCQKRLFGKGCVQEARTYCCFNSKLARMIHEQGRKQLKSFDGVDANNCRGFYPEEFQYLDFSQIDLSEYYGDLKTRNMSEIESDIDKTTEAFLEKIY